MPCTSEIRFLVSVLGVRRSVLPGVGGAAFSFAHRSRGLPWLLLEIPDFGISNPI